MEAYYTCQPLLIISADRPSRFRGTGAPQSCEQPGIFGVYAPFVQDLNGNNAPALVQWDQKGPAHINVCFEEPRDIPGKQLYPRKHLEKKTAFTANPTTELDAFFRNSSCPLVIVGELEEGDQGAVEEFLLRLNAPVILEPPSGLSHLKTLKHLQISRRSKILETGSASGYPIDGVLRIGGVPTLRLWRDLENLNGKIPVFSLTPWPFSGLSFCETPSVSLNPFLLTYPVRKLSRSLDEWLASEQKYLGKLEQLYARYPQAEQTLYHQLSLKMERETSLYLGNSLPIREWDIFGSTDFNELSVSVNRGVNGIDGQLSTAIGFGAKWIILGDLTTLYDLTGPWFLTQLKELNVQIVVVNNSGGQIFAEMFKNPAFLNTHSIRFKAFAEMWNLMYEEWKNIPESIKSDNSRVIELVPDSNQTREFWAALKQIT